MSAVETTVRALLEPGELRKAIHIQKRHRGREIVKATISFEDYFNLRDRSFSSDKWRGFMHQQPDGSWRAFGVLLDYEHDSSVERTLTVCEPSISPVGWNGELQPVYPPPSTSHS